MTQTLTAIQSEALAHVMQAARAQIPATDARLKELLERSRCDSSLLMSALQRVQEAARVVVHFHPDRLDARGITVAESLLQSGLYRNQFETGLSNGGLTAFRGGMRDVWELGLFGGVYQRPEVTPPDRPKYGALELLCYADGASPRFGSCYFRLRHPVSHRCSFTNRDSYYNPDVFGTLSCFTPLLVSLCEEVEQKGRVLGMEGISVAQFLSRLSQLSYPPVAGSGAYGRTLDDYVEAQIHGSLVLEEDVETLVADPAFRGTPVGTTLKQLCTRYSIVLDWHGGFRVLARDIPEAFRGAEVPLLAQFIAGDGFLDTAMLGRAAASLWHSPADWSAFGTPAECLQLLKKLWHALAFYGQPLQG